MAPPVLYLVIQLGSDQYLLDAVQVIEIVPLLRLKVVPSAPTGVAGLVNYRGTVVPVVDLNLLATGVPTVSTGATRIVVVRYQPQGRGEGGMLGESLGLLVPATTETMHLDPDSFVDVGVAVNGAPFQGPVLATASGVLQRVTVAALLNEELRGVLYRTSEAA